ncbi:MAG: hypothetical protein Kow0029_03310 [Candidatus Rifleibacteriota bacterium]
MPLILIENGERQFIPPNEPLIKAHKVTETVNENIEGYKAERPGNQSFAAKLAQKTYERKLRPPPERKNIIYAYEIMSSPVLTLAATSTLSEAWHMILDHRFRHIPIVNSSKVPLGMLSDRNLLKLAMTMGLNVFNSSEVESKKHTVGEHFLSPVLTAAPNAEIHLIAKAMFENHIGATPIINEQNSIIGIITRSDILRAFVHLGPIELWA